MRAQLTTGRAEFDFRPASIVLAESAHRVGQPHMKVFTTERIDGGREPVPQALAGTQQDC